MPSRSKAKYPKPAKARRARRKTRTTTTTTTVSKSGSSMSRMGRSLGPFPIRMNTKLVYKAPSTTIPSGGILSYAGLTLDLNNMYDFDYNNVLGNKQPLFYDQVLSVDGPYKYYKVNAWKTTIKFINLSDKALFVYYDPCTAQVTESDTPIEIENRRGIQSFTLTAQSNSKPMVTIKKFQTLKSFFPNSVNSSENFSAGYNASPTTHAYANLLWKTIDGSVGVFNVAVQVQHIFYCTLYNADSIVS